MGKKKNRLNFLEMSAEQQRSIMDAFNSPINGSLNILSLDDNTSGKKRKKKKHSSFDDELEKALLLGTEEPEQSPVSMDIVMDSNETEYDIDEDELKYLTDPEPVRSTTNQVKVEPAGEDLSSNTKTDHTKHQEDTDEDDGNNPFLSRDLPIFTRFPTISIYYNDIIGKMFVDDSYVSTAVNVCMGMAIPVDEDLIPKTDYDIERFESRAFLYILTCKYPSVVMRKAEFEKMFAGIEHIDQSRYILFEVEDYIFCYVVEPDTAKMLKVIKKKFEMDTRRYVAFICATIMACGTIHNAFPVEDDDEIENLFEDRNGINDLYEALMTDPETTMLSNPDAQKNQIDLYINLNVLSVKDIQTDMRIMVDDMCPIEDDEDDEEDDEYEDDDRDIPNLSDIDVSVIDSLGESDENKPEPDIVSENPEIVDVDEDGDMPRDNLAHIVPRSGIQAVSNSTNENATVTTAHTQTNSDMVMPVIRRGQK